MKKVLLISLMCFLFTSVFAQKNNNGMGVEYNTKSAHGIKTKGLLITPTYWLEGDKSLQFLLGINHMLGAGVTKDGPLKDWDTFAGTPQWSGYGSIASPEPILGYSFLYQYRSFFTHETEGLYGAALIRFRKYITEMKEFDGRKLSEPIRDKFRWVNISYQIGYSRTFKSNIILDAYMGLGVRLEFLKIHDYYSEFDWTTSTNYFVPTEMNRTQLQVVFNTGIRLGYAF